MNEVKLKPCPFCGGEAILRQLGRTKLTCVVECQRCKATTGFTENPNFAVKAWNTRHEPPTPGGAIVPAGNDRLGG